MRSRSLTKHDVRLMGKKDATSVGDFALLVIEWLWQLSRCLCYQQVKKISWIWRVISRGSQDRWHSFHCQQIVRWDVSWIVGWCLDRLVTCWVFWPWRSDLWIRWLWIWFRWWFDLCGTFLCLESWHQEFHSDLGWPSIFWSIWIIRRCVLKEIFPSLCLELIFFRF